MAKQDAETAIGRPPRWGPTKSTTVRLPLMVRDYLARHDDKSLTEELVAIVTRTKGYRDYEKNV